MPGHATAGKTIHNVGAPTFKVLLEGSILVGYYAPASRWIGAGCGGAGSSKLHQIRAAFERLRDFGPIWSAAAELPLLRMKPVDHSKLGPGSLYRKAGAELPHSKVTKRAGQDEEWPTRWKAQREGHPRGRSKPRMAGDVKSRHGEILSAPRIACATRLISRWFITSANRRSTAPNLG